MLTITPIQIKKYGEVKPTSHPQSVSKQKTDAFELASTPIAFKGTALEAGLEFQQQVKVLLANVNKAFQKATDMGKKAELLDAFIGKFHELQNLMGEKLRRCESDKTKSNIDKDRRHEMANFIQFFKANTLSKKWRQKLGLCPDISAEEFNAHFILMQNRILKTIQKYNLFLIKGLEGNTMRPKKVFDLAHDYASEYAKDKDVNIIVEGEELLLKHPDGINTFLGSRLADYHFYTILSNLMQNGVKYTKDGSTVNVKIAEQVVDDCKYLTVSVRDEGIGIPKESQEKVLEGVRAKNAIDAGVPGTGYGLRRIKSILEQAYCQYKTIEINSPLKSENAQHPGTEITAFLRLKY